MGYPAWSAIDGVPGHRAVPPVTFGAMAVLAILVPVDREPCRREMTGYCFRMLGSGFEAEDAVQETMLRAWRNADSFERRSAVVAPPHRHQRVHRHAPPVPAPREVLR